MRIGMVCYPTVGGSGIVATELGRELAIRGHEVHFITYDLPFRLTVDNPNIFFHEVDISRYDLFKYPDYTLTLAVKMASVARRYRLNLLHVHYAIPHATSAFLAKQLLNTDIQVITTLHGTDITLVGTDPAYFQIVKFSIEQSDGVTAVSNSLKEQTCENFNICKSVQVIYNFFTPRPEFMQIKPLRHLFVSNHEKLLLHNSNFRSVKHVEDVVNIFHLVQKKIPSKLILLGTGGDIENIRMLVSEKKLDDKVIFLGKNRDVDPYVASADLFLLPSSQESFGLAALEAMAYGVPVIASLVGGLPELIEDGQSGFLCTVGDIEAMSERAIYLLTNKDVYNNFSQNAQYCASKYFSANQIVPQYENFYQKTIERKD